MTVLAPFAAAGRFLKGNIHTHSNRSDGALPPEEVVKRYRSAGYDFLAITDHFVASYGFPITDTTGYRDDRFTTLIGAELHAPRTEMNNLWHLLAVGLPPDFAQTSREETGPQLAKRAHEAGAFIGLAHPAWYELSMVDAETLIEWCHAIEVYNHGCHVMHDKGDGAYMLDGLSDKGHQKLTYACDDAHFKAPDFGGGWIELTAEENSPEAIVAGLKAGAFFSTQGPRIHSISIEGDSLHVECSPAAGVVVAGRGHQHSYKFGQGLSYAEIPLQGLRGSPWFRVIVLGEDGKRAWSNPYWHMIAE